MRYSVSKCDDNSLVYHDKQEKKYRFFFKITEIKKMAII